MSIKIATPISKLFNSSPQVEKSIVELSDALEVRDLSTNTDFSLPKLYHCEYGILHKWADKEMNQILGIINKNPEISFITFHLPACYENSPIENNVYMPVGHKMSISEMRENARWNIKLLREKIGYKIEFGVENNNYFATGAYEIVTEPAFINELLSLLNIKLLLDIGHAQISAFNQNKSTDEYINAFNLDEVYQIHLSSPTLAKEACADSHKELTEEDWDVFKRVLARCPNVQYITIEYYKDLDKLMQMLKRLKKILYEY